MCVLTAEMFDQEYALGTKGGRDVKGGYMHGRVERGPSCSRVPLQPVWEQRGEGEARERRRVRGGMHRRYSCGYGGTHTSWRLFDLIRKISCSRRSWGFGNGVEYRCVDTEDAVDG